MLCCALSDSVDSAQHRHIYTYIYIVCMCVCVCVCVWQPTTAFLPGKFHEQRSLVGYSPCGHKELNTTDHSHLLILHSYQ